MKGKKEQISGYPDNNESKAIAKYLTKTKWKKATLVMTAIMEHIKRNSQ